MLVDLGVYPVPREGIAAEGIAHALHTSLVAVIDAGEAEKGKLKRGDQLEQLDSSLALCEAQANLRLYTVERVCIVAHLLRISEKSEHALGVMRSDKVHKARRNLGGIGRIKIGQRRRESLRVAVLGKIEQSLSRGIIHDAVELCTSEIRAALAVCDLVRRNFPDLADKNTLGVDRMNTVAQFLKEAVGELVGYVKTPAIDARAHIMISNSTLAGEKLAAEVDVGIEPRKDSDSPPAGIIRRPLFLGSMEIVPTMIGRIRIFCGQTVTAEFIKIAAVASRMIENAVEDDLHPSRVHGFDKGVKCLASAKAFVNFEIVRGIVFMVACRLKDGRKIEDIYAERLEVIKFLDDSPKIAAEEVIVLDLGTAIFGILRGSVFPIFVENDIVPIADLALTACKAVEEDMVHHTAAEPLGNLEIGAVNGHAKFAPFIMNESEIDIVNRACKETFPASAENICIVKKPRGRTSAQSGCIEA